MQKNHGDFKSEVRIHLSIKVTKLDAFYSNTEGSPNLSVYRVRTVPYRTVPYRSVPYRTVPYRTVPYPTVFREGPFWSTAQRTVLF